MKWILAFGCLFGLAVCVELSALTSHGGELALVKELPSSQWRQEVESIDQAVEVLTELRNKELARAARSQEQGDRLQFQFPNLIDARRAWEQADKSREIAARYQEEINKLAARKEELLRQHGQKAYSSPLSE